MEEKKNENEMEEWKDVKKGQKTSPVAIVILVILLIAAVAAGLLCGDKLYALVHPTEESNTKTEEKETNKDENKETQEEETKEEEVKPLDLSKCLNCGENWIFSNPSETNSGTHFTIKNENGKVTISINWETFGQFSGFSAYPKDVKYYDVRGINSNVKAVIEGGSGQSINSVTFYYLLENGNVEYTKLFNQKTDAQGHTYYALNMSHDENESEYFASQGTVPNVSKVIKLYNVSVHVENGGGWATTIGALADGSFYDLKVE